MTSDDFSDAALVLMGHGTALNPHSSEPVYQHAAELRRRGRFGVVREAFWKQQPQVAEVSHTLSSPRIFFVLLFISEGFFSEDIIPRALGFPEPDPGTRVRVQSRAGQTWFYCQPVGTHKSMTKIILARAREVVQQFPFPRAPGTKDMTLFIAGHGTEQNENSARAVERQVEHIRALDLYAAVHGIFLDQEPRIAACFGMAQTRNLVVVPFFMSDGLHVTEDLPVMLGEPERVVQLRLKSGQPGWRNPSEKQGKLVWCSSSAGTDPGLADVILERVRDAANSIA